MRSKFPPYCVTQNGATLMKHKYGDRKRGEPGLMRCRWTPSMGRCKVPNLILPHIVQRWTPIGSPSPHTISCTLGMAESGQLEEQAFSSFHFWNLLSSGHTLPTQSQFILFHQHTLWTLGKSGIAFCFGAELNHAKTPCDIFKAFIDQCFTKM